MTLKDSELGLQYAIMYLNSGCECDIGWVSLETLICFRCLCPIKPIPITPE